MIDIETLAERVAAIERAVADGGTTDGLPEAAAIDRRLADVEAALSDLDDRVTELEAATQAIRGYVGGVRAVNRDVERRADLALAKAEALEADEGERASLTVERLALDGANESIDGAGRSTGDAGGGTDDRIGRSEADGRGVGDQRAGLADRIRRIADVGNP